MKECYGHDPKEVLMLVLNLFLKFEGREKSCSTIIKCVFAELGIRPMTLGS